MWPATGETVRLHRGAVIHSLKGQGVESSIEILLFIRGSRSGNTPVSTARLMGALRSQRDKAAA
jgi:hypothetical protein